MFVFVGFVCWILLICCVWFVLMWFVVLCLDWRLCCLKLARCEVVGLRLTILFWVFVLVVCWVGLIDGVCCLGLFVVVLVLLCCCVVCYLELRVWSFRLWLLFEVVVWTILRVWVFGIMFWFCFWDGCVVGLYLFLEWDFWNLIVRLFEWLVYCV